MTVHTGEYQNGPNYNLWIGDSSTNKAMGILLTNKVRISHLVNVGIEWFRTFTYTMVEINQQNNAHYAIIQYKPVVYHILW
jgi:hypothetical protein